MKAALPISILFIMVGALIGFIIKPIVWVVLLSAFLGAIAGLVWDYVVDSLT